MGHTDLAIKWNADVLEYQKWEMSIHHVLVRIAKQLGFWYATNSENEKALESYKIAEDNHKDAEVAEKAARKESEDAKQKGQGAVMPPEPHPIDWNAHDTTNVASCLIHTGDVKNIDGASTMLKRATAEFDKQEPQNCLAIALYVTAIHISLSATLISGKEDSPTQTLCPRLKWRDLAKAPR